VAGGQRGQTDVTRITSHAMVFMLCGIACRWKQITGYYFTDNGFNGTTLQPIIIDILHKDESIGLRINFIISDMRPGKLYGEPLGSRLENIIKL